VRDKHYRAQKLRFKLAKFYFYGAVDKPTAHDVEHAAEHFADHDGHPVTLGEDFQGVSETGVPKSH
jgi:ubiquinol-cytochrome c reductase cytochrome b subunit